MVDIGTTARRAISTQDSSIQAAAGVSVTIRPADAAGLAAYEDFCRTAIHGVPQHPVWVRSWVTTTSADALIVTLHRDGKPAFMLALEVLRQGPFRVARFPGGGHANGNFIASATALDAPISAGELDALSQEIRRARPDIDLIQLERQKPELGTAANPLAAFATTQSPDISLAADLTGGLDALLEHMSGKRKRKKFRAQSRKIEAAGGHRWFVASSPEEVERLIHEFYVLKAARFRKRGIPDVFAAKEVQDFFRQLFLDALEHKPLPFKLYGLEVAGEIHNVKGFSMVEDGMISEFCAMREDELGLSPGFYLDYLIMQQVGADGVTNYDFSVGDEEYKRSWCEIETWLFDTPLPLTLKGRILMGGKMARIAALRRLKSNRALWDFAKRMRARLSGTPAGPS